MFVKLFFIITDCKDANYINCKESARSCISNAYVNDGVLNCPAPQCADEDLGCLTEELQEKVKPIDASSIAISAITSLIFTLVNFLRTSLYQL